MNGKKESSKRDEMKRKKNRWIENPHHRSIATTHSCRHRHASSLSACHSFVHKTLKYHFMLFIYSNLHSKMCREHIYSSMPIALFMYLAFDSDLPSFFLSQKKLRRLRSGFCHCTASILYRCFTIFFSVMRPWQLANQWFSINLSNGVWTNSEPLMEKISITEWILGIRDHQ